MHSDSAALTSLGGTRRDALDHRVDKACAGPHPGKALYALAQQLRDEGLEQRVLYDLFESHRSRRTNDDDEKAFDGLCDAMDFICGWHRRGHPMTLFSEALPEAQSRTREWQDVRDAVATGAVPTDSSKWQTYSMVVGLIVAVVCVHCTIAVLLTAIANQDYTPVAWAALLWSIGLTTVLSTTRRLFGTTMPTMSGEQQTSKPAGPISSVACQSSASHKTAARRREPAPTAPELW